MKRGHYFNWALKSLAIMQKFHSNMYHEDGEPNDELWSDDLNGDERILDQITNWDKDEETFVEAENFDIRLSRVDDQVKEYLSDIKYLKNRIKELKATKQKVKQERQTYLEENNLDYKTIEKRLTDMYPELAP